MSSGHVRAPYRAGSFYPATAEACRRAISDCREEEPPVPADLRGAKLFGGIVPHAGWVYSGATALGVFDAMKNASPKPETIVIFATAHRPDVIAPSLQAEGAWSVPGGAVEIDNELARAMLQEAATDGALVERSRAHEGDHAIEVQLPFVLDALPGARIVPVAVPPVPCGPELGAATARALKRIGRNGVALASTDLTHYGPNYYGFAPQGVGPEAHRWSKDVNDRAFLEKVLALDARGAFEAGVRDHSACGPAAAAAAIACAAGSGARRAVLLEHVTSWERRKSGLPEDFVGYASVVFA
ncbi:MAG: AmmeMemoRadiSam system protein B [Planctomycetes bacterium]|nr:AmmeMemoRadiSam system protein B [Planctomycetota bacterium]